MELHYCCGDEGRAYYAKGHVSFEQFMSALRLDVGEDDSILLEQPIHCWMRVCRDFQEGHAMGNCLACGRMNLSQLRGERMRPGRIAATTRPMSSSRHSFDFLRRAIDSKPKDPRQDHPQGVGVQRRRRHHFSLDKSRRLHCSPPPL